MIVNLLIYEIGVPVQLNLRVYRRNSELKIHFYGYKTMRKLYVYRS